MWLSNLGFFLSEGWRGFTRNQLLSVVATAIVIISLVVLGIFLMGIVVANHLVESVGSKLDVSAYVQEDLSDWQVKALVKEIEQIEGVAGVTFVSKGKAWQKFQKDFQERLGLTENIRANPLPNTFQVRMKHPGLAPSVSKQIAQMSIVDEVRYSGRLAERVHLLASTFRWVSLFFICLLGAAVLLIVVNTIRLTVLARQADIDIMQLVGATKGFIKGPFIVEGAIIGVIGAGASFVILKFLFDVIFTRLSGALPFLPVLGESGGVEWVYLLTAGIGVFLGCLGGTISVSRSLKED